VKGTARNGDEATGTERGLDWTAGFVLNPHHALAANHEDQLLRGRMIVPCMSLTGIEVQRDGGHVFGTAHLW
jgi:hypothetical protein